MEDRKIVTIDLGTSKTAVTIANVSGGNIDVIYYKETKSEGIKRGSVFNEGSASRMLSSAIKEAEAATGLKIVSAAVSMPRCFIRQYTSQAKLALDPNVSIGDEEIKSLEDIAKNECPIEDSNSEAVYCAIAQSFSDGEEFQLPLEDIIGLEREMIEGNYKIFTGSKVHLSRISSTFSKVNVVDSKKYFTAQATAKAVLAQSQMESGVALVDIGGGVTSVTVFKNGIMRYYGSIPFGGKSITNDIVISSNISEHLAENLKKAYGICLPDNLLNFDEKILHINSHIMGMDKEISVKYLSEIVTARMSEIADAVLYLIQQSGLADELVSGIVLTGGGAELGNVCTLFKEKSGLSVCIGRHATEMSVDNAATGIRETSGATSAGMLLLAAEDFPGDCTRFETPDVTYEEGGNELFSNTEPQDQNDSEEVPSDVGESSSEYDSKEATETGTKQETKKSVPAWWPIKPTSDSEKKRKEEKKKKEEERRQREERKNQVKEEKNPNKESGIDKFMNTLFGEEEA